jgi:hypothetical protein
MFRLSWQRFAAIMLALSCILAGWLVSGFYVIASRDTKLCKRVAGEKLHTVAAVGKGTYLRAAVRGEYERFGQSAQTVSRRRDPEFFRDLPLETGEYRVVAPYCSVGLLGQYVVWAPDAFPLHPADQHYIFEGSGWFLYALDGLILARVLYVAWRRPSPEKLCRSCGATIHGSSCDNPLCRASGA